MAKTNKTTKHIVPYTSVGTCAYDVRFTVNDLYRLDNLIDKACNQVGNVKDFADKYPAIDTIMNFISNLVVNTIGNVDSDKEFDCFFEIKEAEPEYA